MGVAKRSNERGYPSGRLDVIGNEDVGNRMDPERHSC